MQGEHISHSRTSIAESGGHPETQAWPHAFRHARAVGLLNAGVAMKTIGDVLGHRSLDSTSIYLKLATPELRAIGLEIPVEVIS